MGFSWKKKSQDLVALVDGHAISLAFEEVLSVFASNRPLSSHANISLKVRPPTKLPWYDTQFPLIESLSGNKLLSPIFKVIWVDSNSNDSWQPAWINLTILAIRRWPAIYCIVGTLHTFSTCLQITCRGGGWCQVTLASHPSLLGLFDTIHKTEILDLMISQVLFV